MERERKKGKIFCGLV
uniref:Uncharacterized protein n=1 Tax=Anguilla anguilla TaxID=7936 RepID=A0A0E9T9S1_ANGAN